MKISLVKGFHSDFENMMKLTPQSGPTKFPVQVQKKPLADPSGTHSPPFKHVGDPGSALQADN